MNCIHRNGDITGYSVRYGVQGSGTQTVSVPGGGATIITISGLTPSTTYSIEVAAVNSAGTGVYSLAVISETGTLAVSLSASFTTSLTVSWTLAEGVTVTSFTISYSNIDTQCFTDSSDITGIAASETMYTVTGLQEGAEYSITVTAMLSDGGSGGDSLIATTMAAG